MARVSGAKLLLLKPNGVYCQYCCQCYRGVRSRSGVFVTNPYTGNRPDKLSRHGSCSTHLQNQLAYQEWQTRLATGSTVADMVERSSILTVDECAFCDAMCCMHRSVLQIRPPFCNLSLSTKHRGAYTRDATFSLAITSPLDREMFSSSVIDNTVRRVQYYVWFCGCWLRSCVAIRPQRP